MVIKCNRPNIVILIKDGDDQYRLSHVSPFVGLGIPILPWWPDKGLCDGKNLIIPNGISSWHLNKDEDNSVQDYLTLSISRADATVDLLHIKGLLKSILFDDPNLKLLELNDYGFNNKNIECAVKSSDAFCKNTEVSINSIITKRKIKQMEMEKGLRVRKNTSDFTYKNIELDQTNMSSIYSILMYLYNLYI